MPVKRAVPFAEGIYFITFTCHKWINLIDITKSYDLIYKWFDVLRQQRHFIVGYVIMPNHVHVILAFRSSSKRINKIVGDGKRFIGYETVSRLKDMGKDELLEELANAVNKSDRARGKLHEVWEDSFDWKECNSRKMIEQKLDYIHNNPCAKKWKLAENPFEYIHSSATYYIEGRQGIYNITNYMELEDIDLTEK